MIEVIQSEKYETVKDVWYKYLSLNTATGAICSTHLKLRVRQKFEKQNIYSYQAFGFDIDEIKRARSMTLNYPESKPFYPLLSLGLSKKDCIKIIQNNNDLFHPLTIPSMYRFGFENNNCWKTGCVQGGIGYWQKMQRDFPEKFEVMAQIEHDLTNLKGKPVTMLKDQGKEGGLIFLKHHPKYPKIKDISMMTGRSPKPLFDCNGFCSVKDLERSETEDEINYK